MKSVQVWGWNFSGIFPDTFFGDPEVNRPRGRRGINSTSFVHIQQTWAASGGQELSGISPVRLKGSSGGHSASDISQIRGRWGRFGQNNPRFGKQRGLPKLNISWFTFDFSFMDFHVASPSSWLKLLRYLPGHFLWRPRGQPTSGSVRTAEKLSFFRLT